ncbi:hypothetical protein M8998_07405 [Sphingobacterium sp. lm-10]|uniref:hypothetical protein n=1 Tax=Sphingobacterium sp. lm-10 TaxID=2944904 RepID=UPI0020200D54|nr:hypothetical protein [Sphingobacterium sp. lm-10]MCL7987761.1 hypothetical protein [Sphingobacterium sp. lm-10]
MSTTQPNTAIMPFTQTDLQSAGSVYHIAVGFQEKYRAKQVALLAKAAANGAKLPKELDEELMNWQVSAKKAVKHIEEQRKPFTEKAHAFIKAFTGIENTLGKELYDPIQQLRDKSAKIHAEEAAAARAKEQAELAAKQKRIDDIAQLEAQLRNGYAAHLTNVKQTMLTVYSGATLGQIDEAKEVLEQFVGAALSDESWNTIALVGDAELIAEVRTQERFDACADHFTAEITKYAEYLLSLIPQRRAELEAGVAESKAAAELARKQEQEAAAAQLAAQQKADADAAKAKQAATVTVMVAQANREVESPKAIESYSMVVGSIDGWRAVVEYYLTNSGTGADGLGKIKLDQMAAFAERQAKATGEMITHSGVTYEPKYKAVARATKRKVA